MLVEPHFSALPCGFVHVPVREPFHYNTGHFGAACAAAQQAGWAAAFPQLPRESFMRLIAWVIRVLVFVLLLVLALANTQTTTLNFLAGYAWQAPLILIGLAFFVVGLLAGLLSALPAIFRLRMESGRLKRELRTARETPVVPAEPPLPPLI
jgi:lipopolysaccharide assembly protein A